MLNSKQRSKLRSLAAAEVSIAQLGKDGVNEDGTFRPTFLGGISDALDKRELVKITVLKNCAFTADETADALASALGAECVATIGHKIILYRKSARKDVKHIEL